jgi:hypothetical protein
METSVYNGIITSEASYIISRQKPYADDPKDPKDTNQWMNGAFLNGFSLVSPYFANLAATALVMSGEPGEPGKPTPLESVTSYVTWYLNSLNWPDILGLHGTVYDYVRDAAGWRQRLTTPHKSFPDNPTKRVPHYYDSADAYAATFISLLRAYVHAGGSTAPLIAFSHQVEIITGIMIVLMKDDHLTLAKPSPSFKYLMDNCEVYRGLEDAAWLFEHVFRDAGKASYFKSFATKNRDAILNELASKENPKEFYPSKSENGTLAPIDWGKWYPDAVSQLFPFVFGVIPVSDERVDYAYGKLNERHPDWKTLSLDPKKEAFPWALVAYVAARMGKLHDLDLYVEAVKAKYPVTSRDTWKWHPAEAGWLLRACLHATGRPASWW